MLAGGTVFEAIKIGPLDGRSGIGGIDVAVVVWLPGRIGGLELLMEAFGISA